MTTEDEIPKVVPGAVAAAYDAARERGSGLPQPAEFAEAGARAMQEALAAHLAAGAEPVGTCTEGGVLWHKNFLENWPSAGTLLYATPPAPAVKVSAVDAFELDSPSFEPAGVSIDEAKALIRSALAEDAGAAWQGEIPAAKGLIADPVTGQPDARELPALNLHDCYLREQAAKQYRYAVDAVNGTIRPTTPAPASDDLVERFETALRRAGGIPKLARTPEGRAFLVKSCAAEVQGHIRSDAATIASLRAEVERLGNLLCLADEAIMELHGCFPLDRTNDRQIKLNDACRAIRAVTGEDYYERKRRAALAPIPAKEG